MSKPAPYTTQLQAGTGLVEETRSLLNTWSPGMTSPVLTATALESGTFANVSARRLRNIVAECFAPRYLNNDGEPARRLKKLQPRLTTTEFNQLLFLYTCRANHILADFVREVYWDRYEGGLDAISYEDAKVFIERAMDNGKTSKRWSETTVSRVRSYLVATCADYGLLGPNLKNGRPITAPHLEKKVATYLAYDLHFAGLGDNAVMHHKDWRLFGLRWRDVRSEFQRQSREGHLIVQAAGEASHVDWRYQTVEEVLDVLAQA